MPSADPIFCVDLEPDERLALRAQPSPDAAVLAELAPDQIVARLDEDDRAGWYYVFADTPGAGAYVGYVQARNLRAWTQAAVNAAPSPLPRDASGSRG